jgi:hypothetical protein
MQRENLEFGGIFLEMNRTLRRRSNKGVLCLTALHYAHRKLI